MLPNRPVCRSRLVSILEECKHGGRDDDERSLEHYFTNGRFLIGAGGAFTGDFHVEQNGLMPCA